jgi:hypothetical protein
VNDNDGKPNTSQTIISLFADTTMKVVAFLFAAIAATTVGAFAPSSSFTPVVSVNNARTSGTALSMAMERTYIMVRSK